MQMPTTSGAFRWPQPALLVLLAAVLAGCASGPTTTRPARDGAEANPPPDLARVPDAEPRLEPIRSGGPNKPYAVLGRDYTPITKDTPFTERGIASWYGRKFHGRRTASGEVYNMYAMTAAHPTLPIPSYARVRNPANGREVVLRINDRGPFHAGRIVDLSYTAALKLDLLRGVGPVELQRITFDEIRSGAWRRDAEPVSVAEASLPAPAVVEPEVSAAVPLPDTNPVNETTAARADTQPARGFWVQLGAFAQRDGAEGFHKRVSTEADWLAPLLAVFSDASMFRLQAGPYPSREEARGVAERVRAALQLVPVIVERR
jgi:rare lipoprotein A